MDNLDILKNQFVEEIVSNCNISRQQGSKLFNTANSGLIDKYKIERIIGNNTYVKDILEICSKYFTPSISYNVDERLFNLMLNYTNNINFIIGVKDYCRLNKLDKNFNRLTKYHGVVIEDYNIQNIMIFYKNNY